VPYYIEENNDACAVGQWATTKDDGEVMGCHDTKQGAIDQAVAISIAEESEYEGERSEVRAEPGELALGDFVEWDSSGGMARGRIEHIMTEGVLGVPDSDFSINATEDDPAALIRIYRRDESDDGEMEWEETEVLVGHRFSTLTKIDPLVRSIRQVNLVAPAYMRAAARQGLRYYEQGLAGDGVVDRTITEARQMARGDALTPDKWVRTAAWIARHMVDLDAPAANPEADGYPSPGVVAHLLWGSGPSKRAARRAMEYAEGVVARLEEENRTLVSVEAKQMAKIETRTNTTQFELRELEGSDGMTFEGYASVFNSESEDLGGFRERVAPGAFRRSLRSRNDIKLLWNHDTGSVLGSTRAGTLTLLEDDRGLKVRAVLPNTTLGRDTAELIRRGDVDSMSFGFSVIKDTWDDTGTNRTLDAVRLHEVSMVAFPAYAGTAGTTVMRGLDKVAKRANVDADELADALFKLEEGAELSVDEATMLSRVVDELKPATDEAAEPESTNDVDMLMLKKKKLELMEKY
jgi:HK97 family phage prohead protease